MGNTPICTIDDTGIHKPQFVDVLAYFVAGMQAIYGDDVYLGNDHPDGQLVGLLASAVDDCNAQTVADYNAYSPATAQGTGLSSVVKVNNIQRKVPTYSTVPLTIYGVAGTEIVDGAVTDVDGNMWLLPTPVVIPFVGQITVTATSVVMGAFSLAANSLNTALGDGAMSAGITPGWQSATNLVAATVGAPVENDAQLRQRQSYSTAIPAQTILQALKGALLAIDGVDYVEIYDNSTSATDANGVPGKCIAVVVDGGDDGLVAQMIALKKGICGTYGTSAQLVTDADGVTRVIRFFRPSSVIITAQLSLTIIGNYTLSTQTDIATALATNISGPIGQDVYRSDQIQALQGVGTGYKIENLSLARDGLVVSNNDVSLLFYERPVCVPAYVTFINSSALPDTLETSA